MKRKITPAWADVALLVLLSTTLLGAAIGVVENGYLSGAGVASGPIDMNGNDITIDADGTSRIELGTDDRFFVYINNVLRFGVGGSIYHYTASDLQGNYLFDSTSAAELGGDCNPATIPNSAGNMVTCNAHEIKGAAAFGSTINVAGEATLQGVSGDGSGKAVCIKADGTLGTCSDAVGAGGTCTCG